MLSVADDERSFALAVGDDEFEAQERGIDCDERDGAIVVDARCDGALPLADVKNSRAAVAPNGHVAEGDDADESLVAVEHGEAANPFVLHVPGHFPHVVFLEAVVDPRRHGFANQATRHRPSDGIK